MTTFQITGCIPAKLSCKQKPKLTQLRSVYALKEAFMRKQDWQVKNEDNSEIETH